MSVYKKEKKKAAIFITSLVSNRNTNLSLAVNMMMMMIHQPINYTHLYNKD